MPLLGESHDSPQSAPIVTKTSHKLLLWVTSTTIWLLHKKHIKYPTKSQKSHIRLPTQISPHDKPKSEPIMKQSLKWLPHNPYQLYITLHVNIDEFWVNRTIHPKHTLLHQKFIHSFPRPSPTLLYLCCTMSITNQLIQIRKPKSEPETWFCLLAKVKNRVSMQQC